MAECNNSILEIIRIVLPSTLVIVGWFVVFKLQSGAVKKQETRKDLRARLDRLNDDLIKLQEKCIEYYTDPQKGFELSTQIKMINDDVRRQTQILTERFLKNIQKSKVNKYLLQLMTAATGGKFESRVRVALKSSDVQLNNLIINSALLITEFEGSFFEAYPPS